MSAMVVVEKCACGASIDLSGDSIHVPSALREWREKHQHEKPQPRRTVILGSRQPRIRAWSSWRAEP